MNPVLTVFTPTFNRAYIIKKLYNSLLLQTKKDFEWLVVDDGSTDDTEELIKSFIAEGEMDICYLKTKNGGKHRAINKGVAIAKGDFFFIVDSDDYLKENALECVHFYINQVKDDDDFAGLCGLKVFPDGRKVNGGGNFQVLDTDAISVREKYHIKGDMAEIYKTEVLRQYPFPEFENENFISEGLVWSRVALKYKLRYFNEPIYVCDYLSDGLTKSIRKHHRESPFGTMLFYNEQLRSGKFGMMTKVKAAINYWRYTINFPMSARKGEFRPVWWSFIFFPLGVWFYKNDLKK